MKARLFKSLATLGPAAVSGFLFAGCACCPSPRNSASSAEQVRQRLAEIMDAAEKKDMPRLDSYHRYGPAFTKFSGGQLDRQDAQVARKGEHDGLTSITGLQMRADDLKIDVFGDTAVATFILNYSFQSTTNRVQKKDRATMVFVKDEDGWRIVHEHLSMPQPAR